MTPAAFLPAVTISSRLAFSSASRVVITLVTDLGIEGFWNDMNEPALFYSEKGLDHAIQIGRAHV